MPLPTTPTAIFRRVMSSDNSLYPFASGWRSFRRHFVSFPLHRTRCKRNVTEPRLSVSSFAQTTHSTQRHQTRKFAGKLRKRTGRDIVLIGSLKVDNRQQIKLFG